MTSLIVTVKRAGTAEKNPLSDVNQTKWTSVIRHLHVTIACYYLTDVD